jgi:hypothetical protein
LARRQSVGAPDQAPTKPLEHQIPGDDSEGEEQAERNVLHFAVRSDPIESSLLQSDIPIVRTPPAINGLCALHGPPRARLRLDAAWPGGDLSRSGSLRSVRLYDADVRKRAAAAGTVVFLVIVPGTAADLITRWLTGWRSRARLRRSRFAWRVLSW